MTQYKVMVKDKCVFMTQDELLAKHVLSAVTRGVEVYKPKDWALQPGQPGPNIYEEIRIEEV